MADDLVLTDAELERITGYRQPSAQLAELQRRGFSRAFRNRLGRVTLTRAHYDAVERGEQVAQKPKVRHLKLA